MTKLIIIINKQVLDKSEARQVEYNLQSLKKAMVNFQQSNDEYAAVLEDSDEIERIFESLLSTEDNFQQCMAKVEKYLTDSKIQRESERFPQKSRKYSIASSKTEEESRGKQDPVKKEKTLIQHVLQKLIYQRRLQMKHS